MGSSKILTVSYGTFSCTLEGFDDSFGTMKAIAEYFRDLAADDRYFGAEPPTPDADMLQRIAEKEIQRRVEAKVSDTGILLRASDGVAAPAVAAESSDAPAARPEQVSETLAEREAEAVSEVPQAPPIEDPYGDIADIPSDSVAAKLARIRAVVNKPADQAGLTAAFADMGEAEANETPADAPVEIEDASFEVEEAEETGREEAEAAEREAAEQAAREKAEAAEREAAEQAAREKAEAAEREAAEQAAREKAEAAEREAAEQAAREKAEAAEREAAEQAAREKAEAAEREAAEQAAREKAEAAEREAAEQAAREKAEAAEREAAEQAAREKAEALDEPEDAFAAALASFEEDTEEDITGEPVDMSDVISQLDQNTYAVGALDGDDLSAKGPDSAAPDEADEARDTGMDDTAPAAAQPERKRTRVIKVKRSAMASALTALGISKPDEAQPTPAKPEDATEGPTSSLTPEAEAELMAELAAVEQELGVSEPQAPSYPDTPHSDAAGDLAEAMAEEPSLAGGIDLGEEASRRAFLAQNEAERSALAMAEETAEIIEAEAMAEDAFEEALQDLSEETPEALAEDTTEELAQDSFDEPDETPGDDEMLQAIAAVTGAPAEMATPVREALAAVAEAGETEVDEAELGEAEPDDSEPDDRFDAEALEALSDEVIDLEPRADEVEDEDLIAPTDEAILDANEDAPTSQELEGLVAQMAEEAENEGRYEAARTRRDRIVSGEQADDRLDRLMDETEGKLQGPEMERRRSAIAHLKAAVAATKAEGGDRLDRGADEARAYREDLASVVRPHSSVESDEGEEVNEADAESEAESSAPLVEDAPQEAATTSAPQEAEGDSAPPVGDVVDLHDPATEEQQAAPARPRRPVLRKAKTQRPGGSPLMLVSEQRIDESLAAQVPSGPVRPRRVTERSLGADLPEVDDRGAPQGMVKSDAQATGIFTDCENFEDFAEKMGADGLEDMLECAAAYASYVEGQPHFSHPQIMRAVAGLKKAEAFSREDSLRSFGQLLRQGKIRKLKRGQFTLSQSSQYTPEKRRAAL
ncbi:hypothetical protein [Vannielia sp.]|uniref:hypothetical protein n=1 Tax=Vannielia sp. TaxID=2813045 RepID=UPI002606BCDF|nr:hypothetical protein [Vannielia sp.]MDF1871694.1 hypothetical protein [Vannielia sp.]